MLSDSAENFGLVIAEGIPSLPLLQRVTPIEERILGMAGVGSDILLGERHLLCAAAAQVAVQQSPIEESIVWRIVSSLHAALATSQIGSAKYAAERLAEAAAYYGEAAQADAEVEQQTPAGQLSNVEMAFGDRIFRMGPEEDKRAQACFLIASVVPKSLWKAQYAGVQQAAAERQFS